VDVAGDSGGGIYLLQANFKLIRIKDKKVVFQGTSFGRAAFERFTNTSTTGNNVAVQYTYSNVRARDDAENRAARSVADDLNTRMAIYFSGAG
jgi:LPS-assembly lipoprotein